MGSDEHARRIYRIMDRVTAPVASVIAIVLFGAVSVVLWAMIRAGWRGETLEDWAFITAFIGVFALLGAFWLLVCAIGWVIDHAQ